MKPVSPERKPPAMKASVRKRPDSAKLSAVESSGLTTSTEVTNTTIASGIRMTRIVLNWRRR
jgi:hypothetical protein